MGAGNESAGSGNGTASAAAEIAGGSDGFGGAFERLAAEFVDLLTPDMATLARLAIFLVLAILFWFTLRGLRAGLQATVFSPHRVDPTVGRLATRLFSALFIIIALGVGLWVSFDVNVWGLVTALGLLSVALGFGMQTTVANIMGGINLALDKPFVIGDRIRIGDTWGDVEEIGLRSTKILTTKREVVVVPNKILDEKEIWNFTLGHTEIRVDIMVSISYDADARLARTLMMQVAVDDDDVLSYPRPQVLTRDFQDSGIGLQLRAWIPDAKRTRVIESRLREGIKKRFDECGVEIPFPYRTLVYKTDLPKTTLATEEQLRAIVSQRIDVPTVLVLSAGVEPARRSSRLVARIAQELDLALLVVHMVPGRTPGHKHEAEGVFTLYREAAEGARIDIETEMHEGDVVQSTMDIIDSRDIDLIIIGSRKHGLFRPSQRISSVSKNLKERTDTPILVMPPDYKVPSKTLEHYKTMLEARSRKEGRQRAGLHHDDDTISEPSMGQYGHDDGDNGDDDGPLDDHDDHPHDDHPHEDDAHSDEDDALPAEDDGHPRKSDEHRRESDDQPGR